MAKEKKSLVEEALIQMKKLEDVVAENAKGILNSTMKKEINELVKESLKETKYDSDLKNQKDDELDEQDDMDNLEDVDDLEKGDDLDDLEDADDNPEMVDAPEIGDEDTDEVEPDFNIGGDETDFDDDEDIVDLTHASEEEILKVFKAMGEDDGIIIKKEGDTIDLDDSEDDVHYKIDLGEQDSDDEFAGGEDEELGEQQEDEVMYEISMDDDDDWDEISFDNEDDYPEEDSITMTDGQDGDVDDLESWDENPEEGFEKMEAKEGFKPKGIGMGKAKFTYDKPKGGFDEKKKQGTKGVGMGKPKFEFKEEDTEEGVPTKEEGETTEASRTLGSGRRFGRHGLPKPKAAPRHLSTESTEKELQVLRERNEEYRKALNIFRTKLNEVAIFNSNLAYATRLFTEHSTTKQEKINILRRFDSVETLKESKTLYKTIKDELSSQTTGKIVKESINEKIEKTPVSGAAVNLIESKTYENPQFLRIKDLMAKMNATKIN